MSHAGDVMLGGGVVAASLR
jgi:hypothetical protein